jgi:hypothetical protein
MAFLHFSPSSSLVSAFATDAWPLLASPATLSVQLLGAWVGFFAVSIVAAVARSSLKIPEPCRSGQTQMSFTREGSSNKTHGGKVLGESETGHHCRCYLSDGGLGGN